METFIHDFKGYDIHQSKCKVHILLVDNIYHICFEDLGIGTSVTNASEQLATEIVNKLNINFNNCKFYEYYNYFNNIETETFDEIQYTWINNMAKNPNWMPSDKRNLFYS